MSKSFLERQIQGFTIRNYFSLFIILIPIGTFAQRSPISKFVVTDSEGNRKWGAINRNTNDTVLTPIYDDIGTFKHQKSIIKKDGLMGLIDSDYKFLFPVEYAYVYLIYFMRKPYWRLGTKDYTYALFDDNLNIILPFEFSTIQRLNDTLIRVSKNQKWGILTAWGAEVVPIEYDGISTFENGFAKTRKGEYEGLVDQKGNIVAKAEFERIGKTNEGLVAVQKNGKYGYLNTKGEYVISPSFSTARAFNQGLAIAQIDSLGTPFGRVSGLINTKGEWVVKPIYHYILPSYARGYYRGKLLSGGMVLMNSEGKRTIHDGDRIRKIGTNFGKNRKLARVYFEKPQYGPRFKTTDSTVIRYYPTSPERYCLLMDVDGKKLSNEKFKDVGGYGTAIYVRRNKKWMGFDQETKRVFNLEEKGQKAFVLIAGHHQNATSGAINKYGEIILPFEYQSVIIKENEIHASQSGIRRRYDFNGKCLDCN